MLELLAALHWYFYALLNHNARTTGGSALVLLNHNARTTGGSALVFLRIAKITMLELLAALHWYFYALQKSQC